MKEGLQKELVIARRKLASVRFAVRSGEYKNTSEVKKIRKNIAWILTEINS